MTADPDSAATLVKFLRFLALNYERTGAPKEAEKLRSAAEALERETAIVDRIWDIFGRPSYAELKGRSIYNLIQEKIDAVDTLSKQLAEARARIEQLGGWYNSCERHLTECKKQLAEADAVLKAATEFSEIVWHHGMPEQAGPIQIRLTALLKATRDHDMRHASRVGQKDEERKA